MREHAQTRNTKNELFRYWTGKIIDCEGLGSDLVESERVIIELRYRIELFLSREERELYRKTAGGVGNWLLEYYNKASFKIIPGEPLIIS